MEEQVTKIPVPILSKEKFENGQETHLDKFLRSIMDQEKDYPLPEPVINIVQNLEKIPLLTLKSYSLWQGKQKSKKTTLLAMAIAAFINPKMQSDGIWFEGAMRGKVLFFDNEQGQSYAARTMKLILKMADLDKSPNLIYCDLREFSPQDRIKIIEAGINATPGLKIVIIDGIVDLLNDFMDAAEGHLSITNIIRLCSLHNIHAAGVLHQNKADKNARAHVGTISSQKCEIEISTEVDTNDRTQSIVECVNSRGIPFQPFAIKWEKGTLPIIVQDWTKPVKGDSMHPKVSRAIANTFEAGISLGESAATKKMYDSGLAGSDSTAKRYLK